MPDLTSRPYPKTFHPVSYGLRIEIADTPENRKAMSDMRHRMARVRWKWQYRMERMVRNIFKDYADGPSF